MSENAIETLAQATGYLEGLINRERQTNYSYCRLDLEPIRALLDAVGRPQDGLSIIHVAGSKGKGSTCLIDSDGARRTRWGFHIAAPRELGRALSC
jgi:folylpolyglutamate synthase/dihydropteroate synthase